MMSLPLLVPTHRLPLPSFEAEWLAAVLGLLCAACLLVRRRAALAIPPLVLGPALLAALVLVQIALGMPAYASNGLVFCTYLGWAALIAIAGRSCAASIGAISLYPLLARMMLAGGLLAALAGLIQYLGVPAFLDGIVAAPSSVHGEGVYGNLAQQNHFATHIAMATASAVYLLVKGVLRRWLGVLVLLLLTVALGLSGSRSVLLYAGWIACLYLVRHGGGLRWRAVGIVASGVALLIGAWVAAAHVGWLGPRLARMVAFDQGFGPRTFLWSHAWRMFTDHPWLGVGVDRFAQVMIGQLDPHRHHWGIDQYAHNLVLQLLAVTGLAGTAALLLPLAALVRRVWRAHSSPDRVWPVSLLGILVIHSMLEQPLHYAYFLGIAAFVAGSLDPGRIAMALTGPLRWGALGAVAVALMGLGISWSDYGDLSTRFYDPQGGDPDEGRNGALILRLHANPLFRPLAELISPASFVAPDAPVTAKLALNTRLLGYAPTADVLFRQSALLAEAGRVPDAMRQFRQAALAYPAELPIYVARFTLLGQQEPQRYGELARFARQYIP